MALIYANAVNKRMNQAPCRKISADSSMRGSYSKSRETTPRKKSCAAALYSQTGTATEGAAPPVPTQSVQSQEPHPNMRRSLKASSSRLSSAEIVSKTEEELRRKHSSPLMSQSMISSGSCTCRKGDEKRASKKSLKKTSMHSSMIARLDSDSEDDLKERKITVRRAQTARETRTHRSDSEGSVEKFAKRKSSVLERMRRKLSSLKF
ncbi:unnamed protein product, partial [Mesorhabditis spiculigera]